MSDVGWILGAYVIVLGGIALYTMQLVPTPRPVAREAASDEDKTWT